MGSDASREILERWSFPVGPWSEASRCGCGGSIAPLRADADGSAVVLCKRCERLWRWRTDPDGHRQVRPVRLLLDEDDARRVVVRESSARADSDSDAWDHRVHWATVLGLPGVARRVPED